VKILQWIGASQSPRMILRRRIWPAEERDQRRLLKVARVGGSLCTCCSLETACLLAVVMCLEPRAMDLFRRLREGSASSALAEGWRLCFGCPAILSNEFKMDKAVMGGMMGVG
jgi:hypothetical protein